MSTPATGMIPPPARPSAGQELLELHREGALAAQYPRLKSLLAELSGDELYRAGQLLARLDPDEVRRQHPTAPVVTVAVTGHGTLAPLLPALTAEIARHGLVLRSFVADFDSYVFDLSDPRSALHAANPDVVLCVLDPMVVVDELPTPWQPSDVARIMREKTQLLGKLTERFATASPGTLVLNTLPLPRRLTAQLVDHRSRAEVGALWREANARLLRLAVEHRSLVVVDPLVVVDLEPLIAEGAAATDWRLSLYAKAHLSRDLLSRYAREVGHLVRHLAGRTKKCLVLDLDGTVWGGVIGEEGMDGIEVADSYRGEAFRAFQRTVKQIGSQGILIAAVSKNDIEEPALHIEKLLRDGWFDVPELTAEDQARPSLYRDEVARADFLRNFDSIAGYLRELAVWVRLAEADERDLARVSQLTLRTNQFNLTTRRLQPADLRALVHDPAALVLAIHAGDRFGDNGLVGAVLARRDANALHIENFLLSCRVFARGIEHACLASLLRHAHSTGIAAVYGAYRRTAKNGSVKDFYPRYGFAPFADDGMTAVFRHDLVEVISAPPHVRLTESYGGNSP
jgi:predicted enzyme involved in methoxymalonyl-ACP biosynthesis